MDNSYKLTRNQMRPLINMNGTSRHELVKQRTWAMSALSEAMDALSGTHPHGRDYQGYTDNMQFARDLAMFKDRHEMLKKLYSELEAEALAIQEERECE